MKYNLFFKIMWKNILNSLLNNENKDYQKGYLKGILLIPKMIITGFITYLIIIGFFNFIK